MPPITILESIADLVAGLTTFEDDGDQDTANPTKVTLRIRICCNNKYATLPFTVPAEYAAEMGGLVDIVESKLPVTFASCYNEDIRSSPMQVLAEPVILMQETSYKSRRLRFSKWITAAYPNDLQCYEEWYERNVENGEESELLMEIRIRTDGSTEPYRLIKGAGKGFFKLGMHLFHPLMVEPQTEAEECMIWNDLCRREALCFVDLTETNTDNYFPERRHRRPNVGRAVQQINGSWTIVYD